MAAGEKRGDGKEHGRGESSAFVAEDICGQQAPKEGDAKAEHERPATNGKLSVATYHGTEPNYVGGYRARIGVAQRKVSRPLPMVGLVGKSRIGPQSRYKRAPPWRPGRTTA